ncbi:hypothetical protein F5Y16DRAFT_356712 [Xylariaceae sp. FL0255]|nr:hypothetical protein F5Y16DRAFT_356712 [Xylariaceae sp. FL0255]
MNSAAHPGGGFHHAKQDAQTDKPDTTPITDSSKLQELYVTNKIEFTKHINRAADAKEQLWGGDDWYMRWYEAPADANLTVQIQGDLFHSLIEHQPIPDKAVASAVKKVTTRFQAEKRGFSWIVGPMDQPQIEVALRTREDMFIEDDQPAMVYNLENVTTGTALPHLPSIVNNPTQSYPLLPRPIFAPASTCANSLRSILNKSKTQGPSQLDPPKEKEKHSYDDDAKKSQTANMADKKAFTDWQAARSITLEAELPVLRGSRPLSLPSFLDEKRMSAHISHAIADTNVMELHPKHWTSGITGSAVARAKERMKEMVLAGKLPQDAAHAAVREEDYHYETTRLKEDSRDGSTSASQDYLNKAAKMPEDGLSGAKNTPINESGENVEESITYTQPQPLLRNTSKSQCYPYPPPVVFPNLDSGFNMAQTVYHPQGKLPEYGAKSNQRTSGSYIACRGRQDSSYIHEIPSPMDYPSGPPGYVSGVMGRFPPPASNFPYTIHPVSGTAPEVNAWVRTWAYRENTDCHAVKHWEKIYLKLLKTLPETQFHMFVVKAKEPMPEDVLRNAGCGLIHFFGGVSSIHCITVKPGHRGKSLGRGLIRYALDTSRKMGYKFAMATATDSGYNLLCNVGFREIGRVKQYSFKPTPHAAASKASSPHAASRKVPKIELDTEKGSEKVKKDLEAKIASRIEAAIASDPSIRCEKETIPVIEKLLMDATNALTTNAARAPEPRPYDTKLSSVPDVHETKRCGRQQTLFSTQEELIAQKKKVAQESSAQKNDPDQDHLLQHDPRKAPQDIFLAMKNQIAEQQRLHAMILAQDKVAHDRLEQEKLIRQQVQLGAVKFAQDKRAQDKLVQDKLARDKLVQDILTQRQQLASERLAKLQEVALQKKLAQHKLNPGQGFPQMQEFARQQKLAHDKLAAEQMRTQLQEFFRQQKLVQQQSLVQEAQRSMLFVGQVAAQNAQSNLSQQGSHESKERLNQAHKMAEDVKLAKECQISEKNQCFEQQSSNPAIFCHPNVAKSPLMIFKSEPAEQDNDSEHEAIIKKNEIVEEGEVIHKDEDGVVEKGEIIGEREVIEKNEAAEKSDPDQDKQPKKDESDDEEWELVLS